jgi:hypothetical protein
LADLERLLEEGEEGETRAADALTDAAGRATAGQLTIAKLPFAKEIDEFVFADTPWCVISLAAAFWSSSAIWRWSAARARVRRTWPSAAGGALSWAARHGIAATVDRCNRAQPAALFSRLGISSQRLPSWT